MRSGGLRNTRAVAPGSQWTVRVASTVGPVAILVVFAELLLPRRVPVGELLYGAVIGSVYALNAIALILVYRANRVINFALAEIGTLGAVLYENLLGNAKWPWPAALVAGVGASVAAGFLLERFVARRFSSSSRLVLSVATLGMAQLIAGIEFGISNSFHSGFARGVLTTPLTHWTFTVGGARFDGNAVLLLAAVPVVVLALEWFLHRSAYGVAMRAAADNAPRARLLGIPVKTVSTVSWAVAALITGLATVLRTPVTGVITGGSSVGPDLLLKSITVAVIARFSNLRTAVLAGLLLGSLDSALNYVYSGSTVTDPVFVVILIIASLALYRPASTRLDEGSSSSWSAIEEVRQLPRTIASRLKVRSLRWGTIGVVAALFLTVPALLSPQHLFLASDIVIYAIVAVSLVVVTGWSGQISLGQIGVAALGAAVAGRLSADAHWDFLLSMLIAGAAGAAASMLLGIAASRVRGFIFAVTSLGFAVAIETYFLNQQFFPYLLPTNRPERPVLLGRFSLSGDMAFYYFCAAVLALVCLAVVAIRKSRTGRVLIAVRDNDRVARSFGISQFRSLLTTFAISGFIAGIAGALFVIHDNALSPSSFPPGDSIVVFAMAAVGGLGSVGGAVLGAVIIKFAQYNLDPAYADAATGVGLLIVLLVLPSGLASLYYRVRDRVVEMQPS